MFDLVWGDEPKKRGRPSKALRKFVYGRDNGICRVCGQKADPFDFQLGHDKPHSRGGKLTPENLFVVHPSCNQSMGDNSLRQTKRAMGIQTPEERSREILKDLTLDQLKVLAKKHNVRVKGRVEESLFFSPRKAPSKRQYVNAIAKVVDPVSLQDELRNLS